MANKIVQLKDGSDNLYPQDVQSIANNANLKCTGATNIIFTPTSGTSYSGYGNCYYNKIGRRVHVHVGISGLTANTGVNIFTLPTGYRPNASVQAVGISGQTSSISVLTVSAGGVINITSVNTYAKVDIEYDAVG